MNDFMKYEGRRRPPRPAPTGRAICPPARRWPIRMSRSSCKIRALQARLCHHPGDAVPRPRPATCRSGEHAGAAPDCAPHLAGAWFRDQRARPLPRHAPQRQRRRGALQSICRAVRPSASTAGAGWHGADADGVRDERHLQLARRSVALGLRAGGLSHVCV